MANNSENKNGTIPPYVSYVSFSNALSNLAEHGIPTKVDTSILGNFSGGLKRQLIQAFRFMLLIDENDTPTERLHQYAKADPDERKRILAELLRQCFRNQVDVLPSGTPQQLRNSFDNIKAESSVKAKCIVFFYQAARAAGIEISTHILRGIKTRTPRTEGRKRKKQVQRADTAEEFGNEAEFEISPEKVKVPVPLGVDKTWVVYKDRDYTEPDLIRFI
ncbi:MAG: DUF5343 domain-containing protein, partial [Nitrospinae bacterium]|nr:DUF5343 domain-containing protein [Nitrospinota bacterium]